MKKSIQILVVEDSSLISLDIQRALKFLGYGIAGSASTGAEAIEAAERLKPDLILMDIRLKGDMDGIEAARQIKLKYDIPVVYLTAYADEATVERAKLTEPLGYLIKPFEERELNSILQVAIYKHHLDQKLRESEKWLSTTLKSIGDGVIATDSEGKVKFMNPVAELLTGWTQEEAAGKSLDEVFIISNEETGEIIENPVLKVLENGVTVGLANHTILTDKKGINRFISDTASPILDDSGKVSGVVLVFQDVTTKKIAEIAVRISEEKFRSVFEKSAVGMIICNSDGEIKEANLSFCKFLNCGNNSGNLNLFEAVVPEQKEKLIRLFHELDSGRITYFELELEYQSRNRNVWGYSTAVKVADARQNHIIIVVQDITRRKITEIALKEQEESYRSLIESSIDAIYVLKDRRLLLVNKAWEDLFGYSRKEATSASFDIISIVAEESKEDIQQRFSTLFTAPSRYEMKAVSRTGDKFDLDVSVSRIWWKGDYAYQGVYRDITKRKLEEERLKYAIEVAERSDKLKNEFLAHMSHEIRTPLNNILTFTSLLKDELEDKLPAELESTFSIISNSAQRLIRTIESLLNLSRIQTGNYDAKFETIDLYRDILDDLSIEFYMRASEKNIQLNFTNNAESCLVKADRFSVTQIFVNLIDNAIKYTPSGFVNVLVYNEDNNVIVEVSDSGIGISEEFIPNLFNPFSQEDSGHSRPYEGTGLGLALVKKYVTINEASISVMSKKGSGTNFKIAFVKIG
jgi:PAS domain S-box-containing protein